MTNYSTKIKVRRVYLHFILFIHIICITEERLENAVVRVGRRGKKGFKKNSKCGVIQPSDIAKGKVLEVTCNTKGRYLSINLPGKNYLTLCEVEAYVGECKEGKTFNYKWNACLAFDFFIHLFPDDGQLIQTCSKFIDH
jgi:hypothetical protein